MGSAARRRWAPAPRAGHSPKPNLKLVKPVEDPAIEAKLCRETVEACLTLRCARGDVVRRPKSKDQPHQILDELDVMLSRGEITRVQFEAGRRYGGRYREAMFRGVIRSSLRFNDRSRKAANYDAVLLSRIQIFHKLHRDRQHAFGNNRRAVDLCDALLGRDGRIEARGETRRITVEYVSWALTRLAYSYGLLWP